MTILHNNIRKVITKAANAVMVALVFISCSDFLETDQKPIRLMAGSNGGETRAGKDIQSTTFDSGETVNVYITGKSDDIGNEMIANPATCITSAPSGGKNLLTPTNGTLYYTVGSNSKANIWAVYPSRVTANSTSFTVMSDQTEEDDYKASDLMYAAPDDYAKSNEAVNLGFNHKMAKLVITATAGSGYTVASTLILNGIKQSIAITPGGESILGDLATGTPPSMTVSNGGAVLFPPQTITADKFIYATVYNKSTGAVAGYAGFDIASKTFEAGKEYHLNLAISADNLKDDVTILGWSDEYGEITVTPSGGYEGVTIETITDQDYTGSPITPDPVVQYGTDDKITLVKGTDYRLEYVDNVNAGTAQLLLIGINYYAGLAKVQSFNIKQVAGTISFSETSKTISYSIGATLTNTVNNTGDGLVRYSSDNTQVATVEASSGLVSIWNEGTAVITATVANGTNYTYATKTATYTITVNRRAATNLKVSKSHPVFYYDGTAKQLTSVVVTDDDNVLAYGTDYTYTFYDAAHASSADADKVAVNAGIATLKVTGMGNYSSDAITDTVIINKGNPTISMEETSDFSLPVGSIKARRATTQNWAESSVTYSSSSPSIASVSTGGVVLGVAGGSSDGTTAGTTGQKVTITAYVAATSNYNASSTITYNVTVITSEYDFTFRGYTEKWIAPATGVYKLEAYGASGGDVPKTSKYLATRSRGGNGAYVTGQISLTKGDELYISVGQEGQTLTTGTVHDGSTNAVIDGRAWNGGGYALWHPTAKAGSGYNSYIYNLTVNDPLCGGGGATDFAINGTANSTTWKTYEHLFTRILVAGGGGGAIYYSAESTAGDGNAPGGDAEIWEGEHGGGDDRGFGGGMNHGGCCGVRNGFDGRWSNASNQFSLAYDGLHGCMAGSEGVFGEGGFYWLLDEGNGMGGGGWFGGGSASHLGNNGSGGGGSSYAWTDEIKVRQRVTTVSGYNGSASATAPVNSTLQATITDSYEEDEHPLSYYYEEWSTSYKNDPEANTYNTTGPRKWTVGTSTSGDRNVSTPYDLNYTKLTNVSGTGGYNDGNGKAKITLLTIN